MTKMPATVGRVKMPHNNRLSTSGALKSNDMWAKTIGHDPYAGEGEKQEEENKAQAEHIMELARLSNVADGGAHRGVNFAQQVFWGVGRGPPKGWEVPEIPSEDDDDEPLPKKRPRDDDSDRRVKKKKKSSKKKKEKKKKDRKRRRRSSDDDSDSDASQKKKN